MYQSVGHEAIRYYADAMELPLFQAEIAGGPRNQDKDYTVTEGDEVEDLFDLMSRVKVGIIADLFFLHLCRVWILFSLQSWALYAIYIIPLKYVTMFWHPASGPTEMATDFWN